MNRILMGLLALLVLTSCSPEANRADAPVMPKIEGCKVERYVVRPCKGCNEEMVYVARCTPTETVSTSMSRSCGKNCRQKITTITTTEGTPDSAAEIPKESK